MVFLAGDLFVSSFATSSFPSLSPSDPDSVSLASFSFTISSVGGCEKLSLLIG